VRRAIHTLARSRQADKTQKICVNPLYPRHPLSMNPQIHLIIALVDVNQGRRWNIPGEGR
jgi:hypothetical protein